MPQDLLHRLGAIDKQGGLTARGSRMAQWGIEPRLAAILDYARAVTIILRRQHAYMQS